MTACRQKKATCEEFVEKFKSKKTTDDCYTPPEIYEIVKRYAIERYGLYGRKIVRPFWPGGDYESYDYQDGCVVIDNPPFSIISKICRDYTERGIDFFLFAPHLTNFSIRNGNHIICGNSITYENGAKIATSFMTSFGECRAETAPKLYGELKEASRVGKNTTLPSFQYPNELLTVNDLEKLCKAGINYGVHEVEHVRILDAQKNIKKSIYGGGLLISHKMADIKRTKLNTEKLKQSPYVFMLSEREQRIVDRLSERENMLEELAYTD